MPKVVTQCKGAIGDAGREMRFGVMSLSSKSMGLDTREYVGLDRAGQVYL